MSKPFEKKKQQPVGWLSRHADGQHFPVLPMGDKSKLPKALQRVSFSEIPEYIEERQNKDKTAEELAEEALIDQAIQEEIEEKEMAERNKNILVRIQETIDKANKKARLKQALDEARAEQADLDGEPNWGKVPDEAEMKKAKRAKKLIDENDLMG